ncbi:MAG: stage II sporulation protein D [Clostridia bacterium]|nr:stage II sporulation protein D [Clostridia bacterium]
MNKLYGVFIVLMIICMLTIPLIAINKPLSPTNEPTSTGQAPNNSDTVLLYDIKSKKTLKLSPLEYTVGVVASEIPASFDTEALKAQAVAAYTVALHFNKDLSNDPEKHQGYIDSVARKEKWGSKFDEYEKKVTDAVKSVLMQKITYNNKPILAVYHAISGGKTESAQTVWGKNYDYLVPVESAGDVLAPDYISKITYTKDEFISMATALGLKLSGEVSSFISTPTCTDSGTVKSYKLGGKTFTGQQMRKAFSLRSANFELSAADNKLVFTVRGYGHGVGLSQYGANYMAQQGSDYKEILKWYYKGCEIQ